MIWLATMVFWTFGYKIGRKIGQLWPNYQELPREEMACKVGLWVLVVLGLALCYGIVLDSVL